MILVPSSLCLFSMRDGDEITTFVTVSHSKDKEPCERGWSHGAQCTGCNNLDPSSLSYWKGKRPWDRGWVVDLVTPCIDGLIGLCGSDEL